MNKKINKHTSTGSVTDSEELFKHLQEGDANGFDDFEKEALEGFSSLENIELSKKVNDELTKKIEDKYFKKEGSKKPFIYWSMAAGLALIIGLSVFFFNNMTKKEASLAYSEKAEETNQKLQEEVTKVSPDISPSNNLESAEPQKERNLGGEKGEDAKSKTKSSQDLDSRTTTADVPKSEPGGYVNGPVNAAPKVALEEEQKNQLAATGAGAGGKDAGNLNDGLYKTDAKKLEDKTKESNRDDKPDDKVKQEKMVMQSTSVAANKRNETKGKKSSEQKEYRANDNSQSPSVPATKDASGEGLATDELASHNTNTKNTNEVDREKTQVDKNAEEKSAKQPVETVSLKGGVAKGDVVTEMPMRRSSYFKTPKFANHNDYFKAEIDKNEILKTNLLKYNKSFRIDLIIDEKGKVTKATADIPEKNCADCKKEMEKIILSMPAWEPAELNNGRATQQSFYFNYLYK